MPDFSAYRPSSRTRSSLSRVPGYQGQQQEWSPLQVNMLRAQAGRQQHAAIHSQPSASASGQPAGVFQAGERVHHIQRADGAFIPTAAATGDAFLVRPKGGSTLFSPKTGEEFGADPVSPVGISSVTKARMAAEAAKQAAAAQKEQAKAQVALAKEQTAQQKDAAKEAEAALKLENARKTDALLKEGRAYNISRETGAPIPKQSDEEWQAAKAEKMAKLQQEAAAKPFKKRLAELDLELSNPDVPKVSEKDLEDANERRATAAAAIKATRANSDYETDLTDDEIKAALADPALRPAASEYLQTQKEAEELPKAIERRKALEREAYQLKKRMLDPEGYKADLTKDVRAAPSADLRKNANEIEAQAKQRQQEHAENKAALDKADADLAAQHEHAQKQYEEAKASGDPRILGMAGDALADIEQQMQQHIDDSEERRISLSAEEQEINRDVENLGIVSGELNKRREASIAQQASQLDKALPGAGARYNAILTDAQKRADALKAKYPDPEAPEAKAAFEAFQKDVQGKVEGITKEAQAKATERADDLRAARVAIERDGFEADTATSMKKSGLDPKNPAHKAAYFDANRLINLERPDKSSWEPGDNIRKGTGSATLSDGSLHISPQYFHDPLKYAKVVEASEASDEEKAKAMADLPRLQLAYAESILPMLKQAGSTKAAQWIPGIASFQKWQAETKPTGTEAEQASQYLADMNARGAWSKGTDNVLRSLLAGFADIGTMAAGTVGLLTSSQGASEAAADWSKRSSDFMAPVSLEGGDSGLGSAILGQTARMAGPMAATLLVTRGLGGGMATMSALSAAQTAGSQYADSYGQLREQGMKHGEAWKQTAPYALASGMVTAMLTAAGGRTGFEAALGTKAGQKAAKEAAQGYWRNLARNVPKQALAEIPEELPDELFSQISQALATDPNADIPALIGKFWEDSPAFLGSIALMGGAGGVMETRRGNQQPLPDDLDGETPGPTLPEDLAAADVAISAWIPKGPLPNSVQDAAKAAHGKEPTPEQTADTARSVAQALVNIAQGQDPRAMSPEVRRMLGIKTNSKDGSIEAASKNVMPLVESVPDPKGKHYPVITDAARDWLTKELPSAGALVKLSYAERADQIKNPPKPAKKAVAKQPKPAKMEPSEVAPSGVASVVPEAAPEPEPKPIPVMASEGAVEGGEINQSSAAVSTASMAPKPEGANEGSSPSSGAIDTAAHTAATSPKNDLPQPTEAQKKAGNYPMGHLNVSGLAISIENPDGSERKWTNSTGETGVNVMKGHYGYIKRADGADGDKLDALVKTGTPEDFDGTAFVIHQNDPKTGAFDEHKVYIGFDSAEEAKAAYLSNYQKGWKGFGSIEEIPMADLASGVKAGALKGGKGQQSPQSSALDAAKKAVANAQVDAPEREMTRQNLTGGALIAAAEQQGQAAVDKLTGDAKAKGAAALKALLSKLRDYNGKVSLDLGSGKGGTYQLKPGDQGWKNATLVVNPAEIVALTANDAVSTKHATKMVQLLFRHEVIHAKVVTKITVKKAQEIWLALSDEARAAVTTAYSVRLVASGMKPESFIGKDFHATNEYIRALVEIALQGPTSERIISVDLANKPMGKDLVKKWKDFLAEVLTILKDLKRQFSEVKSPEVRDRLIADVDALVKQVADEIRNLEKSIGPGAESAQTPNTEAESTSGKPAGGSSPTVAPQESIKSANESSDDALRQEWWDKSLTTAGRASILKTAGFTKANPKAFWRNLPENVRSGIDYRRPSEFRQVNRQRTDLDSPTVKIGDWISDSRGSMGPVISFEGETPVMGMEGENEGDVDPEAAVGGWKLEKSPFGDQKPAPAVAKPTAEAPKAQDSAENAVPPAKAPAKTKAPTNVQPPVKPVPGAESSAIAKDDPLYPYKFEGWASTNEGGRLAVEAGGNTAKQAADNAMRLLSDRWHAREARHAAKKQLPAKDAIDDALGAAFEGLSAPPQPEYAAFEAQLESQQTLDLEDDQVSIPQFNAKKDSLIVSPLIDGVHLMVRNRDAVADFGPHEFFFNDNNDNVLGFARLTKSPKEVSINLIYVDPDRQGQGIGSAFYKYWLNQGIAVKSDKEITDATAELYKSLVRQGYGYAIKGNRAVLTPNASLSANPQPVEQVAFPKDRREVMMKAASTVIDLGLKTPQELAARLDKLRPDGALRKYARAFWRVMTGFDESLEESPDWNAVFAGIDQPAPAPSAKEPTGLISDAESARLDALNEENAQRFTKLSSNQLSQLAIELGVRPMVFQRKGIEQGEALDKTHPDDLKAALDVVTKSKAKADTPASAEANIPAKEVTTPEKTKEKKPADTKALRAMKTYLLEKLNDAIAEAPDKFSADFDRDSRVVIEVPGDGTFTLVNGKQNLQEFAKKAKSFPTTTPGSTSAKLTTPRPTGIPALGTGKPSRADQIKAAALVASTDSTRIVLNNVLDFGNELVATNGRALIRIPIEGKGTAEDPVLYTAKGGEIGPQSKHEKDFGKYPNYKAVIPQGLPVIHEGLDTGRLWQVLNQARAVFRDVNFSSNQGFERPTPFVQVLLNPDGSVGVVGEVANQYVFSVPNAPDGSQNMAADVRSNLDTYEHNRQDGAQLIGRFDADYLMESLQAMRALGHEKVKLARDLEQANETAPMMIFGDKAEVVIMSAKPEVAKPEQQPDTQPNDSDSSPNLEPGGENAGVTDSSGETGIQPQPGPTGRDGDAMDATGEGSPDARESGTVPADVPAALGGDTGAAIIREPDTGPTELLPGDFDPRGSLNPDVVGVEVEQRGSNDVAESLGGTIGVAQSLGTGSETRFPEIKASAPALTEDQAGDVAFVEKRLATKPGALLTNGTGTGKTFSGLGVVKRMLDAGKQHILIVAPSDKVVNDWIATAKEFFDIQDVGQLESIQDNGTSNRVVVTTYANMGQNPLLVNRPWDAVVTDEAHYLSQSKDGNRTNALDSIRALTLHRSGAFRYADMALPQDAERLAVIMAMSYRAREQFADEADAIRARLEAKRREYEARYKATAEADRPKVVMLSATPFAYHFSLDYAEGYLFDFPPENTKTVGRYNHASPRSQFYMENFGYRMRTGKLTAPENATATGILERRFAEKLMREGAMSGRALQVEQDYGRHFVLTESELGTKVDEIVAAIRDNDYLRPLGKYIGLGDYLERRYLLEALKARESVERIKQHLALGRKVVVFHDYKKGGASNPLNIEFPQGMEVSTTINGQNVNVKLADALAALKRAVPHFDDTARQLNGLLSPLQLLEREFSGIGIFNGDVPAKQRRAVVDTFNKSGSAMNVVLVQRASGKEGISLHDRDGKHQRVFIDLGIPGRPTDAIQSEGRIYRHGVMSNAIVEYLTTGTSFERHTFAQTIAQRASTAENLAMGERARALLQSFATGYMDAETMEPGPQQGTGGKAKDAAQQNADPFKDALALYYTNAKKTSRNKSAEGIDYFATPEPLGFKMVEWAGIRPGEKVLEPSAGHGAIARFFPDSTNRHAVEPSNELAGRLALNATDIQIHEESFEDYHIGNKFDAIVMNPPFGTAGKTAMDHVIKATKHLRNGGRIVALIPEGSSMEKRFDKWMESEDAAGIYMVAEYGMPPVTFERAGTSVKARVVVLDKTDDPTGIRSRGRRDFAGENVKDFFDAIKESSAPDRATVARLEKPEQTAETEAAPMTRDTVFPKASVAEPNTFQPADAWHAKKGKPTYVAKISRHLSNDEYAAAKATATKFSGYYSKYDKAGAIPGFQFDTAEDRDGFLAKMMPTGEALSANPTDPGNIRNARAVPYRGAKKGDVLRPYLENMNNRARAGAIIRSFERDWAPFFTYMDDLASREKRKAALTKILNKFAMGDSAESRSLWRWYSELDPAEYELLFEDSERVKEAKELLPYLENLTLSANPQPNNDAEYMAAVESGDVAKQQAMVDAAAKVAGYDSDSPFYFGAREKGLKVTEIGDSIFVTDDLDAAKDYADSENEPQSFYLAGKIAEIEDLDIDWSASRWSAYHLEDGDNYSDLDLGYLLSNKKHRRTIAYELRKAGFAALHFSGDVSSYNQIEHDSWLVADSSQIKSADPITRDEQGNVIPLSQRFNPASDSILYANPQPRSQSITDMAAKAAAIVKGEQAPEVLQSIRRGLLTLAEVNKDERLAMKGKGAAVFFQPAAKAAPFGTLELRNAFQKAASGKSSAVLSIREVFNAAKERNPGLNAPAFMAQVKADYYAGLVGLEPPEQASTVEAAGPFKLRDSMGIESTSMSFLPTTEAEMIDAAERDERTPDDILQDWASTPLQSNPQPAIDPVTEGDTPTTESNRANPGDSPLNRRAAANSRAKYEAEEMTQVDFDELRKKVAEELERDEQANLDDILYKLSDIETNGGGLSIEDQEKVRQLANILSYRGRIEGDRMLREQADKLWIANASIGSELARGMGLRRDQFKTPQERLDDAMGNILAPSQEMIRKRTINVKTKKERDTIIAKIIEENDAKISKILARNGLDQSDLSLSVDDRHAMQVALMELPQVKRYLASLPNEQFRNAVTMSMRGYDDDAIARQTGLSAEAIERTTETFRNEVAKPAISNEIKVGKQTFGGFIDAGKNAIKWVLEKVSLKANPTPAQQAAAAANAALQNQVLRILNATIPTKKQRNKRLLHPVRVGGTSNKPITIYVPYNPADWEQVYRMARELSMRDATGFDKTYEWWINGILSGPQTHVVNTASNLLSTAWHYGPQWFASATVNSLVRDPKSTQWGEFRHLWAGFMKGIEPAMTNFKQAWKTEADTLGHQYLNQPITAIFQNGQLDKLGNRGPAIMGGKGRVIRIPGRFLVAMDAFAKTLIMHAEVAAYAFRLGKQQKLHGAALTSFIEGEVKKHGSESWEAAYETATELTFQDENEITKGIEKIVNAGKMNKVTGLLFKFLFPFVRTPTNIYRSGIRKAGGSAGVMMWRLAKGGFYRMTEGTPVFENYTKAQRVKDVSESIMAGIIWMGLMSFGAGEGDEDDEKSWLTITGSRPYGVANAGERASQLRQEGGSNLIIIRLFGKVFRIPYGRYEPMALTVGTLTDAVREFKEMSRMAPADQGNDKLAGEIMKHIVAQAQDKTFLQGISAMSQLIEDIATNRLEIGASFAKQFVNGVIPNFIRQPLRLSPEIMPDAKKANEVFGSKTLGAALADAEPKINEAGMPVRRTASGLVSTLFPVATEPSTALFDSFLKSWNTKKPSEMWNPDTMTKGDWFVYDPAKGSKEGKFPLTTSKAITRFESMVGTSFASKAAQELIKLGYRQGGTPTPAMLEAVQKARRDAITSTRKLPPSIFLK